MTCEFAVHLVSQMIMRGCITKSWYARQVVETEISLNPMYHDVSNGHVTIPTIPLYVNLLDAMVENCFRGSPAFIIFFFH